LKDKENILEFSQVQWLRSVNLANWEEKSGRTAVGGQLRAKVHVTPCQPWLGMAAGTPPQECTGGRITVQAQH
jgi:hypothetical protein